MTLVIAHASRDIGFMIADTLLSSPVPLRGEERPVNGSSHALKIHVLSGQVAIAFAGDPGLACGLIAEIKGDMDATPQLDISQRLFDRYVQRAVDIEDGKQADFMVLRLVPEGKALDKVTLENGVQRVERGYIGDAEGYRALMRLVGPYVSDSAGPVPHSRAREA